MTHVDILTGRPILTMAQFFDSDVDTYDDTQSRWDTDGFYEKISAQIHGNDPLILDLGIGTGYELDLLFERIPGCRVVGVDISERMLERCRGKFTNRRRLALERVSIFDYEYPSHAFDYVIAIATMHHFLQETRQTLYRKILTTLKPGGSYIEADKFAPADLETTVISNYHQRVRTLPAGTVPGAYHIDVPLAAATVTELLRDCGYRQVRLPYDASERDSAIISATSPNR